MKRLNLLVTEMSIYASITDIDPFAPDGSGNTKLHSCAKANSVRLARWLLEKNADVDARNNVCSSVKKVYIF